MYISRKEFEKRIEKGRSELTAANKLNCAASNAVYCFAGFCKRKATAICGKREVKRFLVANYLCSLFARAAKECKDLDNYYKSLNAVYRKTADFSDYDIVDLLDCSISGAFSKVENGLDAECKAAYAAMNYYLDSNRQQVYLSEYEYQKAVNADFVKKVSNTEHKLLDRLETVLTPTEFELFNYIYSGMSIRCISKETGIPNTTLQRRVSTLRSVLKNILDHNDYIKLF
ncbi:MAG: hypothetical protein ACI4KR_00380 [Ruminiclostridium sp.]